ncbi:MAG: diaminobutyrate acetyltransferase [Nitrosarchaeum sp.]|nr:diaminobutyrate acetyltransferase [Nitrosarchaeum sp.]
MTEIKFRTPLVSDAYSIHKLVRDNKPLDENSLYLYVLLCHHFSDTCVVAEHDSRVIGFLSAFVSPKASDTLFVWQAAVDAEFRNQGIAKELVFSALSQTGPSVRYVEATVTPSNTASLKFLQNFATELDAEFKKKPLFSSEILGKDHEQEDLVRIGPIQKNLLEVTA